MADVILADGNSGHNRSSSSDLQFSKHLFGLTEDFIRGLSEIRTMLAVAKSGLCACPKTTQQNYLNKIDNLAEGAMLSFMEIVEIYRDKDEETDTQCHPEKK